MYNDDYIIVFDESGQPYIAHAFGDGAKKYLMKIDNFFKNGRARYFYTQEEIDAFKRERQMRKAGEDQYGGNLWRQTQNQTSAARNRVRNNRRELANRIIDDIKSASGRAKMRIQDAYGTDERERYQTALKSGKQKGESDLEYEQRLTRLLGDYNGTLAGRVDRYKENSRQRREARRERRRRRREERAFRRAARNSKGETTEI